MTTELKEKIKDHYNKISSYYKELWGDNIHHGFWIKGDESKEVAQEQLMQELAKVGGGIFLSRSFVSIALIRSQFLKEQRLWMWAVVLAEGQCTSPKITVPLLRVTRYCVNNICSNFDTKAFQSQANKSAWRLRVPPKQD